MRRKDREITDKRTVTEIVDRAGILHLGLFAEEYPYIVPLHYGYEETEDGFVFYFHCAEVGYKLDLIQENANVCIELETNVELISGGEIPCDYGAAYASFIGYGKAEIVHENREKRRGLELLMWNQTRRSFEIDEKMAESVTVFRVTVKEWTAKQRRKVI